ncbi:MAG TPA: cupin domain-containing protein [Solirubrobacter sp.]|nr:cupin domain-containing protein [Solirubrobacter sp.]
MQTYNLFRPAFEYDASDPDGYRAGMDRFGPKIGAARLGASVYELPPGQALCPYHYESDEEWVLVLEGSLTVRHPGGEDVLGPGDVACFPSGPDGAHKTTNHGTETVRLVMFSTRDQVAYAVYPDSNKIGVWTGRDDEHVLARLGESLEYYDGETA